MNTNGKIDNADLIKFFFKNEPTDKSFYLCRNEKCKPKRGKKQKVYKQENGKGYTNLRNHRRSCVGENFEQIFVQHMKKSDEVLQIFCFSSYRDADVFKLMKWILMCDQPLIEIDNPLTRSLLNVEPVSSKSIRKYILSAIPLVEEAITKKLPEKFGIMFDGWT